MDARDLAVIADERGRAALAKILVSDSIRIVDCRDVTGISSLADTPLLIDVDLHDVAKVKLIKDSLPGRIDGQCRIVAVERGSHQSLAQAKGLGASDVLKRPLDGKTLTACLQRYCVQANAGGHTVISNAKVTLA